MRKNAPALNAIKTKLNEISVKQEIPSTNNTGVCPLVKIEEKIQRVVNSMAQKMRSQSQPGCHYIEAINEFMGGATITKN